MRYKEAVDYLYSLQKYGIKLGLSNSLSLMDVLGNPHRNFKSIHIAGTNGKGSTAAMIAAMLQASGLKVGLYTSPHLVSFNERIRVNGILISEERVACMTSALKSKLSTFKYLSPTFFEFTTAMAFQYFAEESVDIAVVEVGMGGRLDATNVITPLVSIITNIDYDHEEFLGTTLAQIAGEKAGIIKEGIPVIAANNRPEVTRIIEEKSKVLGSKLYIYGSDFRAEQRKKVQDSPPSQFPDDYGSGHVFDYYGIENVFKRLEISLLGYHQILNASLALAAIEIIRDKINVEEIAIRTGLKETGWEGRLEIISRNPSILIDGAHNIDAANTLRMALEEVFLPKHDRLYLIIGMMKDKDIKGFLSILVPLAWEVVVTTVDYERAASTALLAKGAERYNPRVTAIERVSDALDYAEEKARIRDLICVTGSLYTVGEVKGIGKNVERLRV